MNQGIIVLGSINMDLVVRAPRLPQLGETLLGEEFQTFPGGKGANQAVACARLGGRVKMIGRVGNDDFGRTLVDGIAQNGVDISAIEYDSQISTGVALITVTREGNNAIVVAPGANGRISPDYISRYEDYIAEASVLVLQLECPLPAVARAIEIAHARNVLTVLNPAPAQPLPDELLRHVDFLIPNQIELSLLTGESNLLTAINRLQMVGVRNLVVTLGEQGALVANGGQPYHVAAYSVKVIDTTAAGDAFVGAFAVALSEGKSILEGTQIGVAAGALAVTRPGAQPSLPTRQELNHFMQTQPAPLISPYENYTGK